MFLTACVVGCGVVCVSSISLLMRSRLSLILASLLLVVCASDVLAQDTIIVQTLTYDSAGRAGYYTFPTKGSNSYQKVVMQYSMRCKDGLVSTQTDRNKGCGEWDYNCETYITDSTRTDSVKATWPSVRISGWETNKFLYLHQPTTSTVARTDLRATYLSSTVFTTHPIQEGTTTTQHPFGHQALRGIYVIRASELTAAGLQPGPIYGLRLFASNTVPRRGYSVRMANTLVDSADASVAYDTNFISVFSSSYDFNAGENQFSFYRPFVWSGGNILIEFSKTDFDGWGSTTLQAQNTTYASGLVGGPADSTLMFSGSEALPIDPKNFNKIQNEITIAAWVKGNAAVLPKNTTLFEGIDDANRRQLNVHLPWGDGQVYWDCGTDASGTDRVNKLVPVRNYEGEWNHWAFTKNAMTGIMSIYLNGEIFASDTGRRRPIDLTSFVLGSAMLSDFAFHGSIAQFSMWSKALGASEIGTLMRRDIRFDDALSALVAYYKMNEGAGAAISDKLSNTVSTLRGHPVWHRRLGHETVSNFEDEYRRPFITFLQSADTAVPAIDKVVIHDTIVNPAHRIITYAIVGGDSVAVTDTTYLWDNQTYTFDDQLNPIDTFYKIPKDTLHIVQMPYFQKWAQKFEIMSFVTPYGIGLDLGMNGKMWEFDVTDYLPILHGNKLLSVERGAWQEELDIRFLFIKGTPPRDVLDIQQIWPATMEPYQSILNDDRFEPREVKLDPDAASLKIRSYITGHGQEGEFIPRSHTVSVDQQRFTREVWKECSSNPVYPQGGTWIYSRAGWCPGMASDLGEHTFAVPSPGATVTLDYGVSDGAGDSRYLVSNQLVSYGPIRSTIDAAVAEIRRPTDRIEHARFNPACSQPIVVLRNEGSADLSSAKIEYRVGNGPTSTYTWTGTVPFLQSVDVTLPVDDVTFWGTSDTNQFIVTISEPNGSTDENVTNNTFTSRFVKTPTYRGPVVLHFKANRVPEQNYYEIRDAQGNVVREISDFEENANHYDSLVLADGCYTLLFNDDGENGINFWATPNDGSGSLRLRQDKRTGTILKTFNPDFGKFVQYDFIISGSSLGVLEPGAKPKRLSIYPNPSNDILNVETEGLTGEITLDVIDMSGRVISTNSSVNGGRHSLNIASLAAGSYVLRVTTSEGTNQQTFVKE